MATFYSNIFLFDEALPLYLRALELEPDHSTIIEGLVGVYSAYDDIDIAFFVFDSNSHCSRGLIPEAVRLTKHIIDKGN